MFQFSTLLTRTDAGTSRRRPSAADPQPEYSSTRANDEGSLMSAAGQCVSVRVRRDLDDQMHRLAELLDRVESLEFEREAEAADIFSLGKTEWPEEPAEPPRIFDDTESTPGTDGGSAALDLTVDWEFDVYADGGATGDESAASSIVVPPVIPLSTREIECLTAPSVICNSPGTAALEPGSFTPLANPRRTVEHKPDTPARDEHKPDAPPRDEHKPDAPARDEHQPIAPATETECQSLAGASGLCSGVNNPRAVRPCSQPTATKTPQIEMSTPNDHTPASTPPCMTKPAFRLREVDRAVLPKMPADTPLPSGVVRDYCLTPARATLESSPELEINDTSMCLTLAAPNFEDSLASRYRAFDYPIASESTGRSESETDPVTSSEDANRPSSCTADDSHASEPDDYDSQESEPSDDVTAPRSDALIQSFQNTLCDTPASAAAFPSSCTPQNLSSEPFGSTGVHMLVVNDIPACPTPSSIQASACSHSHSPARATHASATEHDSPIAVPRRSLRRTLSLESATVSDNVSSAPSKFGGPLILNILAVIGGLFTLAALAYVASDLASWFGPVR